MAAVYDHVHLKMGPMSVDLLTLGGGWSTICGTLDLVRCAAGSYSFLFNVTFCVNGEALGFCMITLGSKSWGWSLLGRRIGRSIDRFRVCVGGLVVTCGFFATGSVGLSHCLMAWWSACIAAS